MSGEPRSAGGGVRVGDVLSEQAMARAEASLTVRNYRRKLVAMTPVEEADQFTGVLLDMLNDLEHYVDSARITIGRVGFGAIRVRLPSGTGLIIEVSVDQ